MIPVDGCNILAIIFAVFLFFFQKDFSQHLAAYSWSKQPDLLQNPVKFNLCNVSSFFCLKSWNKENKMIYWQTKTTLNKRTASVGKPHWFNNPLLFWDARIPDNALWIHTLRKNTRGPNLLTLLRNARDDKQEWAQLRRYCGKRSAGTATSSQPLSFNYHRDT